MDAVVLVEKAQPFRCLVGNICEYSFILAATLLHKVLQAATVHVFDDQIYHS